MSFFNSLNVSASGLTAQRLRMDIISQNIANANTTITADGTPYSRQAVVLSSNPSQSFGNIIDESLSVLDRGPLGERNMLPFRNEAQNLTGVNNQNGRFSDFRPAGVSVSTIHTDNTPGPLVHDPAHPHADENGYVRMPNVNIVYEMVNMISASRSYEANITAMTTTRSMINRTLEIGQAR
ncbi:MAG: flagellar basal body rod protein FlgC [Defluviitaleaceae bacterium]|nr:flagellar basal body rod protein FlgC [Defluviitaleaceae bacterium]